MAKITRTAGALLDLLEVQTLLNISAEFCKPIGPEHATRLALKVEAARDLLQRSILEAKRVLDEGIEP